MGNTSKTPKPTRKKWVTHSIVSSPTCLQRTQVRKQNLAMGDPFHGPRVGTHKGVLRALDLVMSGPLRWREIIGFARARQGVPGDFLCLLFKRLAVLTLPRINTKPLDNDRNP
jgi:hypothetical protein